MTLIDFRLLFITNRKLSEENLTSIVRNACRSGIKAIQIREKDLSSNDLLTLAKKIRRITSSRKVKLIINDRIDVAFLSVADGVHSPVNGLNARQIKSVNKRFLCGKSVHSIREAVIAEKDGFDYVLFGPIYRTASKVKFGKPQGLNELKKVCDRISIPVFAVGGINPERAKKCIRAGAFGVAVVSDLMRAKSLKKKVFDYENILSKEIDTA